jgi:hypothetical protein
VARIEFKPERPSSRWIWGCAAARARVLREIGGDEPGPFFDSLSRRGLVGGVPLSDTYVDMGTREGLEHALELFEARHR